MNNLALQAHVRTAQVATGANRAASIRRPADSKTKLQVHRVGDPDRRRIEAYIQERYFARFGACIREWLPNLVSLEVNGEVVAAAGYRNGTAALYLERYLDAPVHTCLIDCGFAITAREHVVEAGQFAAMRPGAGRLLVPLLAHHLWEEGFRVAVSTVTKELQHLFVRMGMHPVELAPADADRLTDAERLDWGSYYQHGPVVVAEQLRRVIGERGDA
jgi:hypothetical protein